MMHPFQSYGSYGSYAMPGRLAPADARMFSPRPAGTPPHKA
jgi:hypothetical protein